MGRKPRTFFSGAIFHVIQRGNNRMYIFDQADDKAFFLELLQEKKTEFSYDVLYYTLMDNHYHLLIQMQEVGLDKIMCALNAQYSKYYNKKYSRTGTIYEGRYTAILVDSAPYFIQLIKYIAENPVRAKMVNCVSEYPWNAHAELMSDLFVLVSAQKTLAFFDSSPHVARQVYLDLF